MCPFDVGRRFRFLMPPDVSINLYYDSTSNDESVKTFHV